MNFQHSLLFLSQTTVTGSSLRCRYFNCKTCCRPRFYLFSPLFVRRRVEKIAPVFVCQNSFSNEDNFAPRSNDYTNSQQSSDNFGENIKSGVSSNGGESHSSSKQDPSEEAPFGIGDAAKRYNRKLRLFQLCASTDRGQMSRPEQRSEVEDLAAELESLNPNPNPLDGTKVDGCWELIYSSVPFYKTNPLFLASVTPFLRVGRWRQNISLTYGELVNEVDLEAFPGLLGTVVQQTRVTPVGGERLEIMVDKTSLKGRSIADRLDLGGIQLDIPFGDILRRVQGSSSEIFLDTYYVSLYCCC